MIFLNTPKDIIDRYHKENEDLMKYLAIVRDHCRDTKKQFLNTDPFSLTNNIRGINFLYIVYFNLSFYPDEDIYEKFLSFGITKKDLRWMDGVDKYLSLINDLEDTGIIVYRNEFFMYLYAHLAIQIAKDVLEWGEFSEKRNPREFSLGFLEIEKSIRRVQYGAKRYYKKDPRREILDSIMNDLVSMAAGTDIQVANIKRILNGKIDKIYFTIWLYDSFPYVSDVLRSNKFLGRVLPLFKTVLKNHKFPDLDDIPDDKYVGKDIEEIQVHFLRKWIYKK